jgi:hypothetical protein
MTPKERADKVMEDFGLRDSEVGSVAWGNKVEEGVAAAIREAVAAEREACASLVDSCPVETAPPSWERDAAAGMSELAADLATCIRARGDDMRPDTGPQHPLGFTPIGPPNVMPRLATEEVAELEGQPMKPDDVDYPADHFGNGGR